MSDEIVIISSTDEIISFTENADQPISIMVESEQPIHFISIAEQGLPGAKGDKGDNGQDANVYFGTGTPPDPTGLINGAIFFKYKE